ncbi:transposase [Ochrobactrum sp. S46]|nr:transposase [Ochrobactrum sp. S45]MBK0046422.1 transposase [Ochrobactrum sp. S46]
MTCYTEDGNMPIDRNFVEQDVRIFATGSKSSFF